MSCYICNETASHTCKDCESKTCDVHKKIHEPKCIVFTPVENSR